MMKSPLEQFSIKNIIILKNDWIDISISNSNILMIISISIIIIIMKLNKNNKLVLDKISYIINKMIGIIVGLLMDVLTIKGNKYLPWLFTLFMFILMNNILGLIPYSFTTTSQVIITTVLSTTIMIGVTIIGLINLKLNFLKLFIPSGIPLGIIPLIFIIELISYISRIISLSVRLSANMISGHTILSIVSTFGYQLSIIPQIIILIPIIGLIYILEIGVAIIQAYVFVILTATYIKDTTELH